MSRVLLPVLTVVAAIFALWYAFVPVMNMPWAAAQAERAGITVSVPEGVPARDAGGLALTLRNPGLIPATVGQDRPVLPSPNQVFAELWDSTVEKRVTSKRSLVYHGTVTLGVTLAGFGFGAALGTLLAIGIVYNRAMDRSVMPWVIASQAIPILAIAPMIIVVLASVGLKGFVPKAIIATYLSFFPVVVGMVKGLRSPSPIQRDQMRTWNATGAQEFWRLRLPASVPYLFTSLKVAVAASLVGTIVGELPTGASAGLGARLLTGSYYGQTIQIWSALMAAAILAALLVASVGLVSRLVERRMGFAR
ncbi:MAG: ABC transporter permease [Pseudomonadota bacterium]